MLSLSLHRHTNQVCDATRITVLLLLLLGTDPPYDFPSSSSSPRPPPSLQFPLSVCELGLFHSTSIA